MKAVHFKFFNILFITAFILSGISPACAFISGKHTYIEICASDGSSKTIQLPQNSGFDDLANILNDSQQQKEHANTKQDCGFCFANAKLSKSLPETIFFSPSITYEKLNGIRSNQILFSKTYFSNFRSRAPPAFI